VIVGYDTYMGLLEPHLLAGKETIATGMRKEMERCRAAIEKAKEGRQTAVVSSGDAGIYGMAGLVLELLDEEGLQGKIEVEIIPGIPALAAAAALLGAPLMHDFAVVSLSDLLTPWEMIRSRIEAAARADYVIVLYNPRSKRRNWQLTRAKEILLTFRDGSTPVGIVKNAMREGQSVERTTLSDLDESKADMLTILVVGNSQTKVRGEKMITPRGYLQKYGARHKAQGKHKEVFRQPPGQSHQSIIEP
jgi:precorrin-3B C17-methyltransferase